MRPTILVLIALLFICPASAEQNVAAVPDDQVAMLYFHRTQRCPTCKKISELAEEAVQKGFPSEIKAGTISFYLIDFQDQKNAKLTEIYKITGPTLLAAKVKNQKAVSWEQLPKVWSLVSQPDKFKTYVQDAIRKMREMK
jgi:thiol-disulfide isomerase/thioredoxin